MALLAYYPVLFLLFSFLSSPTPTSAKSHEEPRNFTDAEGRIGIAFVYVSIVKDIGWTFAHNDGRIALERYFDGRIFTDTFETVLEEGSEPFFKELAESGKYKMIVGTSFGYMEPIMKVAPDYPDINFLHVSGFMKTNNTATGFGRIYQARYLSGIAAGAMTKNNRIGYVAAFPIPEVIRGINAFFIGVRKVNPDAVVHVKWTETWFQIDLEEFTAELLLDETDVDVIAQHQDSFEIAQAAEARGKFAVGYNTDMGAYIGQRVLTSPVWNWGPMYITFTERSLNNTWESIDYWGSIGEGIVDVGTLSVLLPDNTTDLILSERARLIELFTPQEEDEDKGSKKKKRTRRGKKVSEDVFCGPLVEQWIKARKDPDPDLPPPPANCLDIGELLGMESLHEEVVDLGVAKIPVEEVEISKAIRITMLVLACVLAAFIIIIAVLIVIFRKQKVILYSSPLFLVLSLVGALLLAAAAAFLYPTPDEDVWCILPLWLGVVGFTLLFGALIAKTVRVWYLFKKAKQKLQRVVIKNYHLIPIVAVLLVIDLILLSVLTAVDSPSSAKERDDDDLNSYEFRYECTYSTASEIILYIIMGIKFSLMALGCYLAFEIRNVSKDFNESHNIGIALYAVSFCCAIMLPIVILVDDVESRYILTCLGILIGTATSVCVLFLPKLYMIGRGKGNRTFQTTRSSTANRTL